MELPTSQRSRRGMTTYLPGSSISEASRRPHRAQELERSKRTRIVILPQHPPGQTLVNWFWRPQYAACYIRGPEEGVSVLPHMTSYRRERSSVPRGEIVRKSRQVLRGTMYTQIGARKELAGLSDTRAGDKVVSSPCIRVPLGCSKASQDARPRQSDGRCWQIRITPDRTTPRVFSGQGDPRLISVRFSRTLPNDLQGAHATRVLARANTIEWFTHTYQ